MDNEDATVALQMPSTVGEGDGTVDVCADLTDIPSGGLECDIVLTLIPSDGPKAVNGEDYSAADPLTMVFSSTTSMDASACTFISIIDDQALEGEHDFTVSLDSTSPPVTIGTPSSVTVTIIDNEDVTIGLQDIAINVNEGDGSVSACTQLTGDIEREVVISIFTGGGDATESDDFIPTIVERTFQPATLTQPQCVDISIISDVILENDEVFSVFLGTSDLDVSLDPDSANITILNDDNVTVGIEQTSYTTREDEHVMVCANLTGETERDVIVTLSTSNGTADTPEDYVLTSESATVVITFVSNQQQLCQDISILPDRLAEEVESFTVYLNESDPYVFLDPSSATVFIEDLINVDDPEVAVSQLSDIASTGQQTSENLAFIAQTLENIATESVPVTNEVISGSFGILATTLNEWPESIVQEQGSRLIASFEQIAASSVQQDDFLPMRIERQGLIYESRQIILDEVPDEGVGFSGTFLTRKRRQATNDPIPRINLPQSLFEVLGDSRVFFTFYRTPVFFPLAEGSRENITVGTSVIGATVVGADTSTLNDNVTILLQLGNPTMEAICVSWDGDAIGGEGNWTSRGCSTDLARDGEVTCRCKHLTNFAVLVSNETLICDFGFERDGFLCIAIPPPVNIIPSDPNTDELEPGRELTITCQSTGPHRGEVQWVFREVSSSDTIPVLSLETMPMEDQIGQLLAVQAGSVYAASLTTIPGIGIQPIANGIYSCIARNNLTQNNETITITVLDVQNQTASSTATLRFSTSSLEETQQDLELPSEAFFFAYLHTALLNSITESTPGFQLFNCRQVGRRSSDEGLERLDCTFMKYDSRFDSIQAINLLIMNVNDTEVSLIQSGIPVNSSLLISEFGFCDMSETVNSSFGNYVWNETMGGMSANQSCNFGGFNEPALAVRTCGTSPPGEWMPPDLSECFTEVTSEFQSIATIPDEVLQMAVVDVIDNLTEVVDLANETVDQSVINFVVIVNLVAESSLIVADTSLQVEEQTAVVEDIVDIIDDVQVWPDEVTADNSSLLIESFESIITTLVLQENFTNLTRSGEDVALVADTFDREELVEEVMQDEERTFSITFAVTPSDGDGDDQVVPMVNSPTLDANQSAFIGLPVTLFESMDTEMVGIFFTFYEEPDLFPLIVPSDNSSDLVPDVGTAVIGANVANQQRIDLPDNDRVTIFLRLLDPSFLNPRCASWNFTAAGGRGNWTTEGCETIPPQDDSDVVECQCNHLTNFAALVDICAREEGCEPPPAPVELAIEIISIIGVVLSLTGITITIITLLGFKTLRQRDVTKFHVQLCIAMFYMLLVFVIGIDRTEVFEGCVTASALIQYFTLVTVMWMGAEAVLMFLKLVVVFVHITKRDIIIFSFVCWLVPIVPVIIPLAIDRDLMVTFSAENTVIVNATANGTVTEVDRTIRYCFIGDLATLFGAFLGPIFAILLFNFVIFVFVFTVLFRHVRRKLGGPLNQTKQKSGIRLLISTIGIVTLFGLTWLFGAFTIQEASIVFQILFALFNSLQGFFIFLFFCVLVKEVRELWARVLFCGRKDPFISTTSSSNTRERRPAHGVSSKPTTGTGVSGTGTGTGGRSILKSSAITISEASQSVIENPNAQELKTLEEPENVVQEQETSLSEYSSGPSGQSGITVDVEASFLSTDHRVQVHRSSTSHNHAETDEIFMQEDHLEDNAMVNPNGDTDY